MIDSSAKKSISFALNRITKKHYNAAGLKGGLDSDYLACLNHIIKRATESRDYIIKRINHFKD